MKVLERIDAYQRSHRRIAFVVAVLKKFSDDSGGYLAALVAYFAFLSLFPLLLLATTVLGFVLSGDASLQHSILSTALSSFPVVGRSLSTPGRVGGGALGLVIGIVGATYGGTKVAQAMQYTANELWNVPRLERPSALQAGRKSLLLLGTAGLGVIASSALAALGPTSNAALGGLSKVLVLIGSLVLNSGFFVLAFRISTERRLTVHDVLPGAVAAAVVWQALQTFGVTYVNRVIRHASDMNGVFAVVLGLLAFLQLAATWVILCIEVDVVRVDGLYPRSLVRGSAAEGDRREWSEERAVVPPIS